MKSGKATDRENQAPMSERVHKTSNMKQNIGSFYATNAKKQVAIG